MKIIVSCSLSFHPLPATVLQSIFNISKWLHNNVNAELVHYSFTDVERFELNMTSFHWEQSCNVDVIQAGGHPPPCAKHLASYLVLSHGMSR